MAYNLTETLFLVGFFIQHKMVPKIVGDFFGDQSKIQSFSPFVNLS